jgi:hypothetical protein
LPELGGLRGVALGFGRAEALGEETARLILATDATGQPAGFAQQRRKVRENFQAGAV